MALDRLVRVSFIGISVLPLGLLLNAQAPANNEKAPAFEVASVKVNKSGEGWSLPFQPGGRVTQTNRTLRQMILFAYSFSPPPGITDGWFQDFQLVGGPAWAASDRFDIVAKMEGNPPRDRATDDLARLMLRTLLADRFQLRLNTETRELAVYALVLARSDGALGPRLRRQTFDCDNAPSPTSLPEPGGPPRRPCGHLGHPHPTSLSYQGVGIERVAIGLSPTVGRVVIDRTGLRGRFDVDLDWGPALGAPAESAPSIFTAVQEQLGLKLESQRGPVEVLVIQHAECPTPD